MSRAYESDYPESYCEGVVTKSITISRVAADLLDENEVPNTSGFINDLIIDALQEKEYFKKRLVGRITKIRDELARKYQLKTSFGLCTDEEVEVEKITPRTESITSEAGK